jgi:uncharacterized membrane protein
MPSIMLHPSQMIYGLTTFQPSAFLTFGLLFLIATPVLRVICSIIVYSLIHDRKYTLITLAVLLIIILSVLLGKG